MGLSAKCWGSSTYLVALDIIDAPSFANEAPFWAILINMSHKRKAMSRKARCKGSLQRNAIRLVDDRVPNGNEVRKAACVS